MLSTYDDIRRFIDKLAKTSGVNGVPLGGTVPLSPTTIKLPKPLQIFPGVKLVGDG